MQRRKFIAGIGSLAAGAAAAMGTGAFTSVTADRSVDVNVVGDGSAYLGLTAASGANGAYVDDGGDQVSVNFNDISDEVTDGGGGVNPNATTDVDSVLTITNQGTQAVTVSLDTTGLPSEVSAELDPDASDYDLGVGDSVDVDFLIDTTSSSSVSSGTLTISADA